MILYCDGASRGNPGPAAIGVVLTDLRGNELATISEKLGTATNNEAEYRALLRGLERAVSLQSDEIEIRTDSDLLAQQLDGNYRVRAANLKSLHQRAQRECKHFKRVSIKHIPRERNRRADALANQALNKTWRRRCS